jgi:hypothetical protein
LNASKQFSPPVNADAQVRLLDARLDDLVQREGLAGMLVVFELLIQHLGQILGPQAEVLAVVHLRRQELLLF